MHTELPFIPNYSYVFIEQNGGQALVKSKGETKFSILLGRVKFDKNCIQRPSTCGVQHVYTNENLNDDINTELAELCLDVDEGRTSVLQFNDADTIYTDNEVKDISMKKQLTLQELTFNSIGTVSIIVIFLLRNKVRSTSRGQRVASVPPAFCLEE